MTSPELTVYVAGTTDDIAPDLSNAFNGTAKQQGPMAMGRDILQFIVDWGPTLSTTLGSTVAAMTIIDKVIDWLQTRPALTLTIASPGGNIELTPATRDAAIAFLDAAFQRNAGSPKAD